MKKILFIAGLEHSGSTLLDILLSSHPQAVGMGEIHPLIDKENRKRILKNAHERLCSCGLPFLDCPIWSSYLNFVKKHDDLSYGKKYLRLIDMAFENNQKDIFIDSSKNTVSFQKLSKSIKSGDLLGFELFVIRIVKDVRAWVTSMKKRYGIRGINLWKQFNLWHNMNMEMDKLIARSGFPNIRIGYEELCFYTEYILKIICGAAQIAYIDEMTDIKNANGHIVAGNPISHHKTKGRRIVYDNRWYFENAINLYYTMRPKAHRYNLQAVYSNTKPIESKIMFEPVA